MGLDFELEHNTNTCCLAASASPTGNHPNGMISKLESNSTALKDCHLHDANANEIEVPINSNDTVKAFHASDPSNVINGRISPLPLKDSNLPGDENTEVDLTATLPILSQHKLDRRKESTASSESSRSSENATRLYLSIYVTDQDHDNQELSPEMPEVANEHDASASSATDKHRMHKCIGCEACFHLSSSLEAHLHRRVIQIRINCRFCRENNRLFFNGCALKHHLAGHGITTLSDEEMINEYSVSIDPDSADCSNSDDGDSSERVVSDDCSDMEMDDDNDEAETTSDNMEEDEETTYSFTNLTNGTESELELSSEATSHYHHDHDYVPHRMIEESSTDSSTASASASPSVEFTPEDSDSASPSPSVEFTPEDSDSASPSPSVEFTPEDSDSASASTSNSASESEMCANQCDNCQEFFTSAEEFYTHLKQTTMDSAQIKLCKFVCGFGTTSSCELLFHEELVHEDGKPCLICPECGFNASDQHSEHSHSNNWDYFLDHLSAECLAKVLQYKCQGQGKGPACTFQCESIEDLVNHYGSKHLHLLRCCSVCSEIFTNAYSWMKHLRKKHCFNRDNYFEANHCLIFQNQCECCQETLSSQQQASFEQLRRHLISSLSKHFSSELVYKCSTCSDVFPTKSDLKLHEDSCDKNVLVENSQQRDGYPPSLQIQHNQTTSKSHHTFNTDRGQRNEDSGKKSKFLLGAWRNLTGQLCQPNHLSPRKEMGAINLQSIMQTCHYCHKYVKSKYLASHEKICAPNGKRCCRACFESCSNKDDLLEHGHEHVRLGHRICLFCDNLPLRKDERLIEHLQLVHTDQVNQFPHSCSICEVDIANRSMLEAHFEFHHGPVMVGLREQSCYKRKIKPYSTSFICRKCDLKCETLRKLEIHSRICPQF